MAVLILGAGALAFVAGRYWDSPGSVAAPTTTLSHPATTAAPLPPLRLTAMSPAPGASAVAGTSQIRLVFSSPVSPRSPMPTLSPPQPGTWTVLHRVVIFQPDGAYLPLTRLTISVPAGSSGMLAADGAFLRRPAVDTFSVVDGSTVRLQQLLSMLDYSPLSFHSAAPSPPATDEAAQRQALFSAPAGSFAWRERGWPRLLRSFWQPGAYNIMTKGLVMEFQADHGLTTDGATSAALWQTLLSALASGEVNTGGYNYALGNQAEPESLTIWHDGAVALHVPANTGIPESPTKDGNFNVFARYRHQVMKGTNPDGSRYADPVQYVAYFNGGDAVHYFPRASYGIPQSLGCIELDLPDAARAWPYLAYGTIVSVIN